MNNGQPIIQELRSRALYLEKLIEEDKQFDLDENSFLSEEEYLSIIELSSVGIYIFNSHGRIISWNNMMEKLTDIRQSDAVGFKIWDVLFRLIPRKNRTSESLIILENKLTSCINEWPYWQRQVYEQRMTSLSGSDLMVKISSFVTASQDGNLLVTVVHDISTQKLAERALASQNEALLKLNQFSIELSGLRLEDDMGALIARWIKELTGAIGVVFSEYDDKSRTLNAKHIEMESDVLEILMTFLNKNSHKIHSSLTEYIHYELTNNPIGTCKSLNEVSFGIIPDSVGKTVQALLMADRFIRVAYMVEGKLYGTSLIALSQAQPDPPMKVLENFVSLAAASLRHRHTEAALSQSEEMLRTITDNAADIIIKLDNLGNILYTSRAFLSYTKDEIVGRNFRDWTLPEYHELMKQSLENVFSEGLPQNFQSRALGSNHEIRWYLSRLSPVIAHGEVENAVLIISDITRQKHAEEALRESEENYRVITQSTLDIIFVMDRFRKLLFINKSVEKVLGYKVEEVIGRSLSEFLPDECEMNFRKQLENVFLHKEICNFATTIYHSDGYLIDVEVNAKLVKLKGEYVELGSIRDITAKKRVETELKNRIERNDALLKANPDLMFVFNSNYKIVDFHSESHDQLLVDPDLFPGKVIDDILPHEVVIKTREKVKKVLTTGNPEYSTYHLQTGDGLKYFESRYVPCGKNEVLSIVRDITAQTKAEFDLNMAKESYLDIFNSVSEAICIFNENGILVDVNSGAETMFQRQKDEFVSQLLTFVAAPGRNNLDEIRNRMDIVSTNGIPVHFDFWAERKNGEVFLMDVIANKGKYYGKNVLIATARDITDKKQDEERIRLKNNELQNLNVEKDKFFSIIAHDLRSPLVAFLGLTEMMAEDLNSFTINEIQTMVVGMKSSADNLYKLLENLLEWSMLQRGLINFEPRKFLLKPKVVEIIESIRESANAKEIEIDYSVPEDLKVCADNNMIASTIRNLVSNAMKFTPKGGKVNLSAKICDNYVEIAIQDTGIGMSQKMVDNLFQLDVKTNRPGTEGEPSSGLGLLLCKEFIEKNDGKICVKSEEGKGTTFHFTIPGSN